MSNFESWWIEFSSDHPEWSFADSNALRREAYLAGQSSAEGRVSKALEAIK